MNMLHNHSAYQTRQENLGQLLERQAALHGDNLFLTQAETDAQLSYRAFNARTNRIAHGLKAAGARPGQYLGIMLSNSPDFLASSYALKKMGAVEVAINATFRGISLSRMINLTGLETLITSRSYLEALAEIAGDLTSLKRLILIDGMAEAARLLPHLERMEFEEMLSNDDSDCAGDHPDDVSSVIMFTSGTTGVSKGCLLPDRCAIRAAESMLEAFDLTADDCVYSPYPLFHVGAAHYDILPALMVGGRAVMRECFSVSNFWPDVARFGATWFMCLGSVQQLLWAAPPCAEKTAHKMRFIWGTPLPVDHDAFEKRFNVRLARGGGYGSTDAGSVALPLFDKKGAGKVLDRYEVAIVDEHDHPLPAGQVGELVIRPKEPAIMASGYFAMPEKTVEAWRNLWFHTGDLARLDDEGDLYWVARISERIRVKGEMVSAYEIEEVVLTHPSVEDCAVLGRPDDYGEEAVHVFATLRPGTSLTIEALAQFCQGRMSRFMQPTGLTILADMPRTPSGKPAKGDLAKLFQL
ncbi:AMP-binding protein [Aestuariispira insulae]|uniref:Crotonobetaine/carnitine-CoA ligase n=1 Tax=Aestuariispira insulae TaxID=1461337 RepID=A0A3D9HS88_9PROT|nr:AMP-binding protein [Aestuariispira insulae]RED52201.1 crotonobetaine/carnitine-CoA ligase [Aestuariispira insulae]